MAGTADARRIIGKLSERGVEVTATATTDYGAELAGISGASETVSRPLTEKELCELIEEKGAGVLVDATHPFAVRATWNALKACHETGAVYVRFERPPVDAGEVIRVGTFREAAELASSLLDDGEVVMHLAGVSTLPEVTGVLGPERVAVRVLPYTPSIETCRKLGVPGRNIIAMQGTFSVELNRALLRDYGAGAVITKDSGETGGLKEKVRAANELGIPVILVERPSVDLEGEAVFSDPEDLVEYVEGVLSSLKGDGP